jgi:hypothetical protein
MMNISQSENYHHQQQHRSFEQFKIEKKEQHHFISEEIQSNFKIEESHHHHQHSSSINNQVFSIISPSHPSTPKQQYYITSDDADEYNIKSDYNNTRPRIESIRTNTDSLRSEDINTFSRTSLNHSHLYEIMREVREKELIENQKYLDRQKNNKTLAQSKSSSTLRFSNDSQSEYAMSGPNIHLREIFAEILALNSKPKSKSNSSSSSSSLFVVDNSQQQQLNKVVSDLMTTDVNKYGDQSPYLNGIMSEALAQNGMKSSLDTYSTYLMNQNKIGINSSNERSTKRITNGVAVLPVSFNDGSIKMPKNNSQSVEIVDYDVDNANTSHLVDIMRDVIISNNEAVAKSVINKRVENVLPAVIMQDSKNIKANQSSSSSSSLSNKMYRQVAFEEVTESSSTKRVVEENSTASTTFHKTVNINNDNNQSNKLNAITDTSASMSNKIAPIVSPSSPTTIKIADRDEIKNALPIGEDHGYGLVRLTVHYDELRTRFSVTIHEAR